MQVRSRVTLGGDAVEGGDAGEDLDIRICIMYMYTYMYTYCDAVVSFIGIRTLFDQDAVVGYC